MYMRHTYDVTEIFIHKQQTKRQKFEILTFKVANKNCSTLIFLLSSFEENKLDVFCESSALQRIHMKYQVLFSLKNNAEIFMNVICCSCNWCFKG